MSNETTQKEDDLMNIHKRTTVPITFAMVVEAYGKVKNGGKATGVDHESWAEFAHKGIEKQLYVVWNRLSSGSYFPQAVREVEIPKQDGKMRKLGIPTIRDRIAQEVVRSYMEKQIDEKFHKNSYGYRPMKSSHEALDQVRKNCLEKDWVLDIDISNFFDEIAHELLLKAVEAMCSEKWVALYVRRWLEAKVEKADGSLIDKQGKGTPQGGVISPLLANLFLHFTLDQWLSKHYPEIAFVRYADDIVLHCTSKEEANELLQAIRERLSQVGLQLNEKKSKIVYCKDFRRRKIHDQVQFNFLGFSFQPRKTQSVHTPGTSYTAYVPEISRENQVKIRNSIRETINWRNTTLELSNMADKLNAKLRGWINYFGRYGKKRLRRLMIYLELKLVKWLRRKHKTGMHRALGLLTNQHRQNPHLFYHWTKGYHLDVIKLTRAV